MKKIEVNVYIPTSYLTENLELLITIRKEDKLKRRNSV